MKRPDGFWTEEKIREEAEKYSTKSQFQKSCNAGYLAALRSGVMDKLDHFEPQLAYWDLPAIFEAAKNSRTRTEFSRKYRGAYAAALRMGIMDEVREFLPTKLELNSALPTYLYTYIHPEAYAYVGITNDLDFRHSKHLENTKNGMVRWMAHQCDAELYERCTAYKGVMEPVGMCRSTAKRFERFSIYRLIRQGFMVVNKHHNPQYCFKNDRYSWE